MNEFERQLRAAGVNVDRPRLTSVAYGHLQHARGSYAKALRAFVQTLRSDSELLTALADLFLSERAKDMSGGSQVGLDSQKKNDAAARLVSNVAASQSGHDRHVNVDRSDTPSRAPGSRGGDASQPRFDTGRSPSSGAASQSRDDSHNRYDRRPAPSTSNAMRAGARAVAKGMYDKTIGLNQITFRTATLVDIINAERAGTAYTRLMTLVRTKKAWPSRNAKVPDVYTESELKDMELEALRSLPAVPVEVANG